MYQNQKGKEKKRKKNTEHKHEVKKKKCLRPVRQCRPRRSWSSLRI
jgi:hypothetical protein